MLPIRYSNSANRLALDYFEALAIKSQVGWTRILRRVEVAPAKPDAVAKGGRRIERDGERWAEPVFGKSNLIYTLIKADGMMIIPGDANGSAAGEEVDVKLF